jgi:hypothetical protein
MPTDTHDTNLLRILAGELWVSLQMSAARDLFGKSLFSLGVEEQTMVTQAVSTRIQAMSLMMTKENLEIFLKPLPQGQQTTPPLDPFQRKPH